MNKIKNCRDCRYYDYTHHLGKPVCTFNGICEDGRPWKMRKMVKAMNILLVIDLQKEFKDNCGQYEKVLQFIKEHRSDYDCILGTVFKNSQDSMYVKHLGYTGCMYNTDTAGDNNSSKTSHPELEYEYDELIIKPGYAAYVNNIVEPYSHIDVIGCDADACVLATVYTLWDRGYDFRILSDYIYTTAKDVTKEDVLKIMRRNFGDCVV